MDYQDHQEPLEVLVYVEMQVQMDVQDQLVL